MREENFILDTNPQETQEWLEALNDIINREGTDRARYLINKLTVSAGGKPLNASLSTDYINTIGELDEADYPGDMALEEKIANIIRWNAAAMVMRSKRDFEGLGGHIASFASISTLYEVGMHHCFKANDLVFFQGHSSEGNYARGFLEGCITEEQLINFRREANGKGLSSYPHPYLMPDYWQFSTVSLGIGGLQAIYAARFLKYLHNRGLANTEGRKVWAFAGDGEMDEVDSVGGAALAARENLDNLIFVVNCNLQRLDGLVRSNSSVVRELEGLFRGAGWHVIKVLWSSKWDDLFARDTSGKLIQRLNECIDGEYQEFRRHGGAYFREKFFGKYPELLDLVKDLSDEDIQNLGLGGEDPQKVFTAYKAAMEHKGQPVALLCQTVKGFGMGEACESQSIAHNQTSMTDEQLKVYRDRFKLPLNDKQLTSYEFYQPAENSDEVRYTRERRKALGGFIPTRNMDEETLDVPPLSSFEKLMKGSGDHVLSTTMVYGRFLSTLLKDNEIGERVVPIFSDEARTFGMEGLFRQVGIYSPHGQLYTPEDKKSLAYYKEAVNGQLLQEGITEAGCMCSWIAAGTSYSTNNVTMIPFFTYYSMFGFQRVGDYIWAAADMLARGFLIGGTAGRTTLAGEGLQHQDGHSFLIASSVPTCRAYDPTYAYELIVILHHGLKVMYQDKEKVFFYVTAMNEKYSHPDMPEGVESGIIKGMYCLKPAKQKQVAHVQLLGAGAILREVEAAAEMLSNDFKVTSDVWSVTSFNELRRDGLSVTRHNLLHPDKQKKTYVETCLEKKDGPVIAATDYMRAYADQIREFIPKRYKVLGTDGFGRSDTREALRHFFEVNRCYIAYTAIVALVEEGILEASAIQEAMKKYKIDPNKPDPVTV